MLINKSNCPMTDVTGSITINSDVIKHLLLEWFTHIQRKKQGDENNNIIKVAPETSYTHTLRCSRSSPHSKLDDRPKLMTTPTEKSAYVEKHSARRGRTQPKTLGVFFFSSESGGLEAALRLFFSSATMSTVST